MRRCAGCGYFHTDRCPLCPCGEVAEVHTLYAVRPIVALTPWDGEVRGRCPGKETWLRRGTFREPAAPVLMRPWSDGVQVPVMQADGGAANADAVTAPPLVPARPAASLAEIAPAALKAGRVAVGAGWAVRPWFWVEHDDAAVSALVMRRGPAAAAAFWRRVQGGTWRTDGALLLGGTWETTRKIGIKALTEMMSNVENSAQTARFQDSA